MTDPYQAWLRSPREPTPLCICGHEWIRHTGLPDVCDSCGKPYHKPVDQASECVDCRRVHPFVKAREAVS